MGKQTGKQRQEGIYERASSTPADDAYGRRAWDLRIARTSWATSPAALRPIIRRRNSAI